MPRIKRWFPVSHDINRDPQLWNLCALYGDRALRIWLEILSIADRSDGVLPDLSPEFRQVLANASRTSGQTVAKCWRTLEEWLWITRSSPPRVAKYAEYHRTREKIKSRVGFNEAPSEPSEPSEPLIPPKVPLKMESKPPPKQRELTLHEKRLQWKLELKREEQNNRTIKPEHWEELIDSLPNRPNPNQRNKEDDVPF